MAKFSALHLDEVHVVHDRIVDGAAEWSKQVSPADYSLRLIVSQLGDGTRLHWDDNHGDEAVCVLEGELDVDGRICPSGGATIVEAGVRAQAVTRGPTRIAHYSPTDPRPPTDGLQGPARPDDHGVHVVGDKGWYASHGHDDYRAVYWADATCPTCRISVFRIETFGTSDPDLPHHHSQDEIIFLLDGALKMGARTYPAGTALSIPANVRYSLRSAGVPYSFLNYRRDLSLFCGANNAEPAVETGSSWGVEVGDFR